MGGHAAPDLSGPAGTERTAPEQADPTYEDVVDLIEDVSIDGMCGVY